MKELAMVFIGGGIGSCLRYLLSSWLNAVASFLPWGTLSTNALACLILGFFAYLFQSKLLTNEYMRLFVMVGICGGFSTFSTFSSELFAYWKNQQYAQFTLYSLGSLLVCHLAILLGIFLGKWIG